MKTMRFILTVLMLLAGGMKAHAEESLTVREMRPKIRVDFNTFSELNTASVNLWSQLVREAGSQSYAFQKLFRVPVDPRVRSLHQNIAEYLATAEFMADDARIFWFFKAEPSEYMKQPFSPLLRQVLINIAIDRGTKIYQRNSGRFLGIDRVAFNESIICVVTTKCDETYTPKYAYTDQVYRNQVRQFAIAKFLAARPYTDICSSFVDADYAFASLNALRSVSIDEDMIPLGLTKPAEEMIQTVAKCITDAVRDPNGFQRHRNIPAEDAMSSAMAYMKGL